MDEEESRYRESISELRELQEEELERRHDALVAYVARTDPYVTPAIVTQQRLGRIEAFAGELARRETERQGKRMEALTTSLKWLTWVITVATIIGVLLTAWAVLSGA